MVKLRSICIIWLCILAGCASQGASKGVPQTPFPLATSTMLPEQPTPLPTLPPIAATKIWPNLHVQRISTAYGSNQVLLFQGCATPDGHYFVVKIQSRIFPGYAGYTPEEVALYSPSTGAVRVIGAARDTTHAVSGMVADNHWVVWYELGLPEMSNDNTWTLYAFNIDTGTTTTIAHNVADNGYPAPQIDQGKLVYDDMDGPYSADRSTSVVQLRDMATGQTQTLAHKAGAPLISWPWVGWDQATDVQAKQGYLAFTNLVTGEHASVQALAIEKVLVGTALVYTLNDDESRSFTYIPDIRQPYIGIQIYAPSQDTSSNSISFNGKYIGWNSLGSHAPPTVYDVTSRRPIIFPVQYRTYGTEYTFVTPTFVTWGEDPNTDAQEAAAGHQHLQMTFIQAIVDLRNP